jgi:hypothetical protein
MTALPAIQCKRVPAIFPIGFVAAPDRVIVQIQELRNRLARFAVVEQEDRIRATGDTVVLALTPHASLKLETLCWGEKTGADYQHS